MNLKLVKRLAAGHLALLLIALIVAGQYLGWFDRFFKKEAAANQTIFLSCPDLAKGCQFKFDNDSYTIKTAAPLSTKQPAMLELNGKAREAQASWAMKDMDMGPNRYRFVANGQDHWQASTALPICSQGRNDWQLTLDIDQNRVIISTQTQ